MTFAGSLALNPMSKGCADVRGLMVVGPK